MNIKSLTIKSTVILELEVMTELTEDEFYDNGNIAENIAALLGINPKKIKIMDVVRFVIFFKSETIGFIDLNLFIYLCMFFVIKTSFSEKQTPKDENDEKHQVFTTIIHVGSVENDVTTKKEQLWPLQSVLVKNQNKPIALVKLMIFLNPKKKLPN